MSIENIKSKIIEEAESSSAQVLKEAESRSGEIAKKAETEASGILETSVAKGLEESAVIKSRKISVAELESRKMLLAAKQDAVKKSFDLALDKIVNLPKANYIDFLSGMIDELHILGGEVVLNERDKLSIGMELTEHVNKNRTDGKITLSQNTIRAAGGFILESGNVELNCTAETIINSVKEELTLKVVKALFD